MDVQRRESAPHRTRGGETRHYFDSAHSRLVITRMPPAHVQNEHRHEVLYDVTWVIEGEVEVFEREGDEVASAILSKGDVVFCAPGRFHNIANRSGRPAMLMTLKFPRPDNMTPAQFAALCEKDWYPGSSEGGH